MSPTIPKAKPGKKAGKTGDALKKQAQKEIAQRIEAIDAGKESPTAAAQAPKAKSKTKPAKAPREAKPKRIGVLEVAAQVLKNTGTPMTAKAMMDVIRAKKLWTTTGKTPEATIYAAIIREVAAKGGSARFKKIERGQFAFNGKAE